MKKFILFIAILFVSTVQAQQQPADRILYGKITRDSLLNPPYVTWFQKNYDAYQVPASVKAGFHKKLFDGIHVEAFFGSWCGDSKRELPRFMKLLDEINFDRSKLVIIATGGSDSLYKQSPDGAEKGKGIFRVPVFIVYKNGIEINRINEFPVQSLERDLLSILHKEPYTPNYRSFSTIAKWLAAGLLSDSNVSFRGLVSQLKPIVTTENELNSLAYLLLKQHHNKEALAVFKINAVLYPESANVLSSLGDAYLQTGDLQQSIAVLEKSLNYDRTPSLTQEILRLIYKAKGFEAK